jgi:Ser/Thr protein kinase RdoA (MazF antagonist)
VRYHNNAIYRVVAADGQRYVLRVTSNHYSHAELRSEMQWLRAMQADPDVRVPAPVQARNGRLVISAAAPTVKEPRSCGLFHWTEGTHLAEAEMKADDYARVGSAAAKMHQRSASFAPPPDFDRPSWDEACWFDPHVTITYERILDYLACFFSPAEVKTFDDLAQQGRARMRELRSQPFAYGLVHGDFHAGNWLFDRDRVGFIDFEDLGWGYFLYDVATALFAALARADYPAVADAFTRAYAGVLPLPEAIENELLVFQALRVVFLTNLAVTRNSVAENTWWQTNVAGRLRRMLRAHRG